MATAAAGAGGDSTAASGQNGHHQAAAAPSLPGFSNKLFKNPQAWKKEWDRVKREDPEVYGPCSICVRLFAAKKNASIPLTASPANFAALENACHWQKKCPSTCALGIR